MSLAELRDLFIVIYSVLGIVALILLSIIAVLLYRKIDSILDSGKATVDNIRQSTSIMSDTIMGPLAAIASVLQGIVKALEFILGPIRRKGERRSGRGEKRE